jgi:hypothetical protein
MIDERCSMSESYNNLLKTVLVMMTLKWFQLQFQAHEREEADHEEDMPNLTSRVHCKCAPGEENKIASIEMKQYKNDLLSMMLIVAFH